MTEIVAVSPKGRFTLPSALRRGLKLERGSRMMVEQVGEYVVMRKMRDNLTELNTMLSRAAADQGFTREELQKLLAEVKREAWATGE